MSIWFKRVFLSVAVLGLLATAPAQAQSGRFLDVIVVLDEDVAPGRGAANRSQAAAIAEAHGVTPSFVYGSALFGYAARIPEARLAVIEGDPQVAYVNLDGTVSIRNSGLGAQALCDKKPDHPKCLPSDPPPEEDPPVEDPPPALDPQVTPWGVGRIGADLSTYTGAGIDIYIIDTGIDVDHADLNVVASVNCTHESGGKPWLRTVTCVADDGDDDNGHGTHVGGTAAALDNGIGVLGVAPGANLTAVKVLDQNGSGKFSWVIAGMDYVTDEVMANGQPAVANMSLSGGGSKSGTCTDAGYTGTDALYAAACNAANAGVILAVAAGNADADAANSVPAAFDDAVITVSATNASDDWPYWSNWGNDSAAWTGNASAPVAIAAPGVGVLSTWNDGLLNTISGTSMATPHVAGAVALWLEGVSQSADYSAFTNARAALLGAAESTAGFSNTSGNPHAEDLLDASGF